MIQEFGGEGGVTTEVGVAVAVWGRGAVAVAVAVEVEVGVEVAVAVGVGVEVEVEVEVAVGVAVAVAVGVGVGVGVAPRSPPSSSTSPRRSGTLARVREELTVEQVRPRRSVLYVPGSNARAIEKSRSLDADALILDLEDAVAPSAKEDARARVVAALAAGGFGGREVVVRVNGAGTPWGADDVRALARAGAGAVLLPKVESAHAVTDAERALDAAGGPPGLPLWAMIETPRGVLAAPEIAAASRRLACLVAGTSDLVKDLRARHTPDRREVLTSLSLVVLAARAHGLAALDGVHLDLADDAAFEAACRQGRDLGFDGKTLVHPRTLAAANRVFAPGEGELAAARRIVEAHAAAASAGQGVTVVDGRLVEGLHVEEARRLLALAGLIAAGR